MAIEGGGDRRVLRRAWLWARFCAKRKATRDRLSTVAIAYTKALYQGDAKKAVGYVRLSDDKIDDGVHKLPASLLASAAAKAAAKADRKGGLKSVEVTKSQIDYTLAAGEVHTVVRFKNDGSEDSQRRAILLRPDRQWKIN